MLNIKEIARIIWNIRREEEDRSDKEIEDLRPTHSVFREAEALIAEITKQNKPVAFLHEWSEYHPFGDTFVGEPLATITNDEKPFDSSDTVSPLFTFPPNKAQIEQETAEAIARMLENGSFLTPESRVALAANGAAKAIRRGAWKEFKK